jgi:O-antigen/teichoic acid export membrane protein
LIISFITSYLVAGVQYSAAYHVSSSRGGASWVARSAALLGLACGAAVGGALLIPVAMGRIGTDWAWWAAAAQPAVGMTISLMGIPLGRGDVRGYNVLTVVPAVLSAIGCLILAGLKVHALSPFLTVWLVGQWSAAIWAAAAVSSELRSPGGASVGGTPTRTDFRRFALRGSLYKIADFFNYKVDSVLVALLRSRSDLGLYAIAVQLAETIFIVGQSAIVAMYGRLGTDTKADAADLTAKVLRHLVFITLVMVVAYLVFCPVFVRWIFGNAYVPAIPAARIIIIGVATSGAVNVLLGYFLQTLGRTTLPLVLATIAGGINLLVCLALVPTLGIVGAALASGASYLVQAVALIRRFSRASGVSVRRILIMDRSDFGDYMTAAGAAHRRISGR